MQIDENQLLQNIYELKKEKNSRISLRAFATQVGASPTTISQIILRKRTLSKPIIEKLLDRLELPEYIVHDLQTLLKEKIELRQKRKKKILLSSEEYDEISSWYYFAILNLIRCHECSSNPNWIAERLGLSEELAKSSLEKLVKLGLIREEDSVWKRVDAEIKTDPNIITAATQKTNAQFLEKAQDSMFNDPPETRDLSGIVMSIDPKSVSVAKEDMKKFRKQLATKLEGTGTPSEVYFLGMQIFPISKISTISGNEK